MATISVKVVPGAKRDRVAGRYGDSIRLQISAPPERGKANEAVVTLLARTLGVRPDQVTIVRGHSQPRKLVQVDGIEQALAEQLLLG